MRLAVCLMLAVSAAWSQTRGPGLLGGGTVKQKDGLEFRWETRAEPSTPVVRVGSFGTHTTPDGWIGKAIADPASRTFFGYDLTVDRRADGYQLTFRPLSVTPELFKALGIEEPGSWKAVPMRVPAPQVIQSLDWISLDVMTNPSTGQKIVDYVTVTPQIRLLVFGGDGKPRSFGFRDAILSLRTPKLRFDVWRESTTSYQADVSVSGPIVSFYIPGKGRYSIALTELPGFEQTGTVTGKTLGFTLGNDRFTLTCGEPILDGGSHPTYVLHEPNYRSDSPDRFSIATRSWP